MTHLARFELKFDEDNSMFPKIDIWKYFSMQKFLQNVKFILVLFIV